MNHGQPLVQLPAPCAGALIPDVDLCGRDAEAVVYGAVQQADGSGAVAWLFVCGKHVRAARRMLQASTPNPEDIDAMSIDTFLHVQGLGIFDANGVDAPVLRRSA